MKTRRIAAADSPIDVAKKKTWRSAMFEPKLQTDTTKLEHKKEK